MSQGKQIYYHNLRENIRNMHPRLIELAIQAGAYKDNDTILTGPMDVALFAQLIIKECASIATRTECPYFEETMKQQLGHTWDMATIEAGNNIRKHFGVKG